MNEKMIMPTDSLYKFYAIFGLSLIIFCLGALVYNNNMRNARIIEAQMKRADLEERSTLNSADSLKLRTLKMDVEITVSNDNFYTIALGVILSIGIMVAIYGFNKWQVKIQNIEDEMKVYQLKKIKNDIDQNMDSEANVAND
ncbi:MAG: hypothetical protein JXR53_12000 [Bacteroidales bacterium]|nr:hypothetical protein [Bacteroidales bacterium]